MSGEGPGLGQPPGVGFWCRLPSSAHWPPTPESKDLYGEQAGPAGYCRGTAELGSMHFEELLDQVGGFGPFQLRNLVLMALPRILLPLHFLLPVFLAAVPSHHCALSGVPANISHQDLWLEAHVPREPDGTFSSCLRFAHPWALPNSTLGRAPQSLGELEGRASAVPCSEGWEYDSSEFSSTIATEVLEPRGQGTLEPGVRAQRPEQSDIHLILHRRAGGRCDLRIPVRQVWAAAPAAGGLCELPGAGPGICGLGQLHHVCHHPHLHWLGPGWLHCHCAATRAGVAGCGAPHSGWCPEHHILVRRRHAAGTGWVPDTGLAMASAGCHPALGPGHHQHLALSKVAAAERVVRRPSYLDLFRTPRLRHISLCCMMVWFGVNFSYYGLTLDLSGLGLTVYQTQLLFGAVEVPSKLVVYLLVRYVGRRPTEVGMLVGAALTFGVRLLVPSETKSWRTALTVIGKAFSEASFTTAYLFTSELYPTVLRQTGLGLSSLVGRLGGSLAPLAALLDGVWLSLPNIAYGGIALLAACTALLLPETRRAQLPETIQDVERMSALPSVQEEEMQAQN
ncbi:solute carrier family 22 member 7 isoform X2 [Heterocephalus glaber]|uniref:Solute carrier family 22 member 7 isoform X2 n=1 Tax=Heterocephalus glaber TaxID=10181 RepID=A0AAX6QXQ6_HETGA|nr:solute carrier family 22 member 7 isoform X2 [Heterocephalus glaber]